MAEVKWIKITVNMFDDEKIKLIESMPDKDAILIIWIKLLTLAGKINSNGYIFLTENIPYTDEMLATVFNRPLNTVRLALETFKKFGMIDFDDNNILHITNWDKHQNIEGLEKIREQNRLRKQRQREREKQKLLEASLHNDEESHVTSRDNHATDIEEDIDIDKEIDIDNKSKKKKIHYAEFVTMTEEEYNKLVDKYGEENTQKMIEKLDNYKGASGKKYKSDYRAILNWVVNEVVPNQPEPKKEIPQSVLEQIKQNNERVKQMKYDPKYLEEVRRIVQQS
jgi:predicted phage replisome organizer